MKKLLIVPLACAVLDLASAQEEAARQLMKAKTGYAHRLLDAVVMEDFDAMREQAFRLKAVAETSDWNVIRTPEYAKESEAFVRSTDRLLEAARERDGDGAALAYMDVTLQCVHCHRYVREHRATK